MNNFATLKGIASVLSNGYTYSYYHTESENGEQCCRPIKSKCELGNGNLNSAHKCKITRGEKQCGNGCTRIIKELEKLERKEKENKKRQELNKAGLFRSARKRSRNTLYTRKPKGYGGKPKGYGGKPNGYGGKPNGYGGKPKGYGGKPNGYGGKPNGYGEKPNSNSGKPKGTSYQKQEERCPGDNRKGVVVKKECQKLNQQQMEMLVKAAEEKDEESTNPLCKDESHKGGYQHFLVHLFVWPNCFFLGLWYKHKTVISTCGQPYVKCRQKQPVPKEKVQKICFLSFLSFFVCLQ